MYLLRFVNTINFDLRTGASALNKQVADTELRVKTQHKHQVI